jgi:hypothetical protein
MNQAPKGPQGPRKYVTREERIRREQERKDKEAEMERKMREAYERVQSESVAGMKAGGMPDLTGDGKVTRADVLKGRGVFKSGGSVKKFGPRYGFKRFAQGGSASKRADGCAMKGKTRGKFV